MRGSTFYPNMDLVRYILAMGVVVAHFNELASHNIPFIISSFNSVGGFFALSGFLMYPSFVKAKSIRQYVVNRARRILPPYMFIVLLCACGGVFITTLSPGEYFAESGLWKYLLANLTFLNWLHPNLPGVFIGPEYFNSAVNGALWTMKVEWCLYLSVPIFAWLISRFRWRKEYTAIAVIILSIAYRFAFTELYTQTGREIFNILARQIFGQLAYFYMGMLIYFYKDAFQSALKYLLPAAIVAYLLLPLVSPYAVIFLSPIIVSSLVMATSMVKPTIPFLKHSNNTSYNIYLIHYPVIQLAIHTGINDGPEWLSLSFILGTTIALSIISNRFIDRRFLRR